MNNYITLENKKTKTHKGLQIASFISAGLAGATIATLAVLNLFNVAIPSLVLSLMLILLDTGVVLNFISCFLCKKTRALHIVLTAVMEAINIGVAIAWALGAIEAFIELGLM